MADQRSVQFTIDWRSYLAEFGVRPRRKGQVVVTIVTKRGCTREQCVVII